MGHILGVSTRNFIYCRYENKGVQWMKTWSNLPPGLAVEDDQPKEGTTADTAGLSKAAKKNLKRKEKKKQQGASQPNEQAVTQVTDSLKKTQISDKQSASKSDAKGATASGDANANVAKKIKNLKKKLKQIEDLQAKINSGELKEPEKEQLEKISKKASIQEEIEDLELELADV